MLNTGAIGPYTIIEQVGAGGMATVYKAHQPKLDRHIALKMMHRMFLDDKSFIVRFEREAHIVGQLDHPNIVPIYDYALHDGQPYLVMKYIEGRTLKEHMQDEALSLDEIRHVMRSVCDALTYAHQKGVLHRDIKPSNIIIDTNGTPYLTDFGLARVAQRGESTISLDTMLGTPHYISPEQAQGESIDARSDVYSTGILLYELVTGRLPFTGESAYAIVHKQIFASPPSPSQLNPDVTPAVEMVLLKALAKEPQARYNTPNELFAAFENALQASGMFTLDASRVHRAKRLGELISQKTPGGGYYVPASESPMPSRVFAVDGVKSVIVPLLSPDVSKPNYSFNQWLEVFIQRIRRMIEEFRGQIRERPIKARFGEAITEIGSDVQHVKAVAQSQLKEVPSYVRKRQDGSAYRAEGIRPDNLSEWGADEASIRRRAQRRVNMRTGFVGHLMFYVLVIGLLFFTQTITAEAIQSAIAAAGAEITLDMGLTSANEAQVVAALQQLASIPYWLVLALLWGSGLAAHALQVLDQTSQFRIGQQQSRIESDMQMLYGADWRQTASAKDYKRVRKSTEKRAAKRVAFWSHALTSVLMIGAILVALPLGESVAQELHVLVMGVEFEITNWALIGTLFVTLPLLIHGAIYATGGFLGTDNREIAIQAEMIRERQQLSGSHSSIKAKRKHDDDFDEKVNLRLTEDGEFTDSFIQEVNQIQNK